VYINDIADGVQSQLSLQLFADVCVNIKLYTLLKIPNPATRLTAVIHIDV